MYDEDVLTTLLGDVVFALGHWEVGLAYTVLAIEELANDAVGVVRTAACGEGEWTAG